MTLSRSGTADSRRPAMAAGRPIDDAVADQAAEWLTLLMSNEANDADRQRHGLWRAAHPDHERAWLHIEAMTQRFKALAPRAGYQALVQCGDYRSAGRRRAAKLLFWGGVAGVTAAVASRTPTWQAQVADHRTGTGVQRTVMLEDGSRVTLNTATAIDLRFDSERRLLRLVSGEVSIVTQQALGGSPDPRPLVVETAQGEIRALGTRFHVRQREGRTTVGVLESAVEITPRSGHAPLILRAGQRTSFSTSAIDDAAGLDDFAEAWLRGQIVADNMRLGDFLAELGRHRPGIVRCDPGLADLRVSGVFPLHDTDRILSTLPLVLPVQVRLRTRYWVTVEPRA